MPRIEFGLNFTKQKYGTFTISRSICGKMSERMCERRLVGENKSKLLPLPAAWLCDGEIDCIDGIDEDMSKWQV